MQTSTSLRNRSGLLQRRSRRLPTDALYTDASSTGALRQCNLYGVGKDRLLVVHSQSFRCIRFYMYIMYESTTKALHIDTRVKYEQSWSFIAKASDVRCIRFYMYIMYESNTISFVNACLTFSCMLFAIQSIVLIGIRLVRNIYNGTSLCYYILGCISMLCCIYLIGPVGINIVHNIHQCTIIY